MEKPIFRKASGRHPFGSGEFQLLFSHHDLPNVIGFVLGYLLGLVQARMNRVPLFLLLAWIFLGGCVRLATYEPAVTTTLSRDPTPVLGPVPTSQRIRVAIVLRKPSVKLMAPESFVLSGIPLEGTPAVGDSREQYRERILTPEKLIGGKAFLEPMGDGQVQVDGKSYRGSMEIILDKRQTLTVINDLPLEEYVMGVLAGEIPQGWPLEALKAQAIAARTFAILKRADARRIGSDYDLENTALFQMYQGTDRVNDNIRRAVVETAEQILTYQSLPIQAFFHSNCGGRTSSALNVWSKAQPYLRPVDCPFGNEGPHFHWTVEIPLPEIARRLRDVGIPVAEVLGLKVFSRDESQRITQLSIQDETGGYRRMKGSAFRMAMGPDLVKSTRFDLESRGGKVIFSGRGWGHGVGLCQEGACGMALKGYGAFDILRHYYHGVLIEKIK